MEKICIVKLRKQLSNPVDGLPRHPPGAPAGEGGVAPLTDLSGAPPAQGADRTAGSGNAADRKLAVILTPDQVKGLKTDPHLASLLHEEAQALPGRLESRDGGMTLQLELPPLPPVRMLKLAEVCRMLQVSRGYLNRLLAGGMLRSYRFGRLRRVMLDDVLSYLASHQDWPTAGKPAAKNHPSPDGMARTFAIKEG
jgi:excisionase family DNA binding protein